MQAVQGNSHGDRDPAGATPAATGSGSNSALDWLPPVLGPGDWSMGSAGRPQRHLVFRPALGNGFPDAIHHGTDGRIGGALRAARA